jgi:hypothetical protein
MVPRRTRPRAPRWGVLALIALSWARPPFAAAELCLPALAEQGRRLHEMPDPSSFWLELLLRQHEACWTADRTSDELRVFVYGSTAVMGYPGTAADSVTEQLNTLWKEQSLPARAFNLAFGANHACKDMLILWESLRYRPGVIVYAMVPADLTRAIAARYRRDAPLAELQLARFMRNSAPRVLEMAAESSTGLELPLADYRDEFQGLERGWARPWTWPLREVAAYVYAVVATRLQMVAGWLGIGESAEQITLPTASPSDCRRTRSQNRRDYAPWGRINPLLYLAKVRDRTGIPVVVVNWPIAHEPSGDCFDAYYTNDLVRGYRNWLAAETSRLGIPFVDVSQILLPRDFLDSRHPSTRGQRKIARALSPRLVPILRQRASELLTAPPH